MLNKKTTTTQSTATPSVAAAKGADAPDNNDSNGASGDKGEPRRRFKEVWLVEDRREGKAFWTRVGTAFENRDGSWNLRLSAVPVGSGNLNIRDPRPAEAQVAA